MLWIKHCSLSFLLKIQMPLRQQHIKSLMFSVDELARLSVCPERRENHGDVE